VLLDHNVPEGVRGLLPGHEVTAAREKGWERLSNGALLAVAEREGFDVFVTGDRNLRFQQSFVGRRLAPVVLGATVWPVVRNHGERIAGAIEAARPGLWIEVPIPLPPRRPKASAP
jgi:hypothetical protein